MSSDLQNTQNELHRRNNAINSLDNYVTEYNVWLDESVKQLGFTKERLQKDEQLVECPIDSSHRLPKQALKTHGMYCRGKQRGYTKDEMDALESGTSFCYENSSAVVPVTLDENVFNEITKKVQRSYAYGNYDKDVKREMPLTGERAQYELTREEKLAIYDHVRRHTNPTNMISEQELLLLQDTKDQKNPAKGKTYLERLAEERDFKRRRQSYRAKNVHVTRKTHTEIIREVIGNQMELLTQMWEDEPEVSENDRREKKSTDGERNKISSFDICEKDREGSRKYKEEENLHRDIKDRHRSKSPSRSNKYKRGRSSSRDRESLYSKSKKGKHSKRRSRSRSFETKDEESYKSKHKHKKHKHKKVKSEKDERGVSLQESTKN